MVVDRHIWHAFIKGNLYRTVLSAHVAGDFGIMGDLVTVFAKYSVIRKTGLFLKSPVCRHDPEVAVYDYESLANTFKDIGNESLRLLARGNITVDPTIPHENTLLAEKRHTAAFDDDLGPGFVHSAYLKKPERSSLAAH